MIGPLSETTRAILLLTGPLRLGKGSLDVRPLTNHEYARLARAMRALDLSPEDLLRREAERALERLAQVIPAQRLRTLLARGLRLGQVVEQWQARGIWVISRADPAYPRRLKHLMKDLAPPVLYGAGDPSLLSGGGLAVVGSRDVPPDLEEYSREVGRRCAAADVQVISGGARGVDLAAMTGAQEEGGAVVEAVAEHLSQKAVLKRNLGPLRAGRLLLVSTYDPNEGFLAAHALERNALIYALADAALVVAAELRKGGTWSGAHSQLTKLRYVPLYVRPNAGALAMNALRDLGAHPWPAPVTAEDFRRLLDPPAAHHGPLFQDGRQETRPDDVAQEEAGRPAPIQQSPPPPRHQAAEQPPVPGLDGGGAGEALTSSPRVRLFVAVTSILMDILSEPRTEKEIAEQLDVSLPQVRAWLRRLEESKTVERAGRPTRYRRVVQEPLIRSQV